MGVNIKNITLILLLLAVAGCHRIQAIYSVQSHPIPAASARLSPEQVTQIIAQTAQSGGWLVDRLSSTELRATQKWRDHTAIVRITVANGGFSIVNDGSLNLLQNGDAIHRQYNDRVHKLETAIEKRLYQS